MDSIYSFFSIFGTPSLIRPFLQRQRTVHIIDIGDGGSESALFAHAGERGHLAPDVFVFNMAECLDEGRDAHFIHLEEARHAADHVLGHGPVFSGPGLMEHAQHAAVVLLAQGTIRLECFADSGDETIPGADVTQEDGESTGFGLVEEIQHFWIFGYLESAKTIDHRNGLAIAGLQCKEAGLIFFSQSMENAAEDREVISLMNADLRRPGVETIENVVLKQWKKPETIYKNLMKLNKAFGCNMTHEDIYKVAIRALDYTAAVEWM